MSTNNTSNSNQSPAITDANAPFDDPDTDAILRSSDNVDFRVFRQFLSYASPVFKAMFALPQVSQGDNSNETKDGLPIIQVSEESKTLETLLLMCYPEDEWLPVIKSLEDVHALLDAAVKYNMERVEKKVRKRLVAQCFLGNDAVRVFAIACRFHLREEAKTAARSTVGQSIVGKPLARELDLVTGRQMCELLHYHEKCIEAIKDIPVDSLDSSRCFKCRSRRINGEATIYGGGVLESYMQRVAGAMSDHTWNEMKEKTLLQAALMEVANCSKCYMRRFADGGDLNTFLKAKIDDAIGTVSLDLYF
ncbi:hypothetical protein PILCRDRAFT_829477 [Piloderma croceum F 1598]|uniref:BTB domain-containing protein n=1 Tax=Piloderma croceum (strain F 1598) TaxID=765440 RepID=A0A0C3EJY9_PILCF|nr:hypothetical protein PILCRDRAFT_829477 [Piloderma croceum F 1598]